MKRIAIVAFYGVGALAIAYLALYAYAMFTRARFAARRSHSHLSQAGRAELFVTRVSRRASAHLRRIGT